MRLSMQVRVMRALCVLSLCAGISTSSFALDPLTQRLTSASWSSALPEIERLDPQSKQRVAQELAEIMVSGYSDEKFRARQALSKFGRTAVAPLLCLLRNNQDLVRWNAIETLGEVGRDAAEAAPQLAAIIQTDQDV